jgi:hypothetical protein
MESMVKRSFTPLSRSMIHRTKFCKTYAFSTTFVKYTYTKLHESLANALVAETRSEKDGWTNRQSPHRAFLFLLHKIKRLEWPMRQRWEPDAPVRIQGCENDRQKRWEGQQHKLLLLQNVKPYNLSIFTYLYLLTLQHIDYSIWVFKDGIK